MFDHINSADWQSNRKSIWQESYEYLLKLNGYSKAQIGAYENFFCTGDLEQLLKKAKRWKSKMHLSEVLSYAPIETTSEFEHLVTLFCQNIIHLGADELETRLASESFVNFLLAIPDKLADTSVGHELKVSIFDKIFGEKYEKGGRSYEHEFPLIGNPTFDLPVNSIARTLLSKVGSCLFNSDLNLSHQVYIGKIDYMISLFPHIDKLPFSKKLLDDIDISKFDYDPEINQRVYRQVFANLYGYKTELNGKNFNFCEPQLQTYIKGEIEALGLGDEYAGFVEMIHQNKGKISFLSA